MSLQKVRESQLFSSFFPIGWIYSDFSRGVWIHFFLLVDAYIDFPCKFGKVKWDLEIMAFEDLVGLSSSFWTGLKAFKGTVAREFFLRFKQKIFAELFKF